jgi:hypothetical protein
MFKRFALVAALLPLAVSIVPLRAFSDQKVIVPGGTVVTVLVVNPISSSTAKVGDTFAIQARPMWLPTAGSRLLKMPPAKARLRL